MLAEIESPNANKMHDFHIIWLFNLADEFNRFKDEHGNFHVDITNDARGLLSLYNAAYLFTHEEADLEKAILFARQHLESMRNNLEYPLAQQVNRALHLPLPRTLRRIEALHYITEYKGELTHNSSLLEFAQLDFNLLQRLHLKELKALSRYNHYLAICIMKRDENSNLTIFWLVPLSSVKL